MHGGASSGAVFQTNALFIVRRLLHCNATAASSAAAAEPIKDSGLGRLGPRPVCYHGGAMAVHWRYPRCALPCCWGVVLSSNRFPPGAVGRAEP